MVLYHEVGVSSYEVSHFYTKSKFQVSKLRLFFFFYYQVEVLFTKSGFYFTKSRFQVTRSAVLLPSRSVKDTKWTFLMPKSKITVTN